jgi:predicted DsbA family dithiol-disulfide isomerase
MPEQSTVKQSGLLEITYYTDPLCCWSWAFEPQWRRLLFEFKGKVKYRYCMAGLLPGWNNYNDTINSVSKPIQMGPVWMHAKQLSGMPIEQNIWISDPPSSSYPACIAVKCAALQSLRAEEHFLRMLREAVMMRGENISKEEVLLNLAEKLAAVDSDFKIEKFKEDIRSDAAMEALRKDLQEVQYHQINRFPSLVIRNKNNKGVLISGYRPYSILLDPIREMIEVKENKKINPKRYKDHWPFITERELEEIA